MTKRILALFLLFLLTHGAHVLASDAPVLSTTTSTTTTTVADGIITKATPFSVNVDHGIPITLSTPAASVFIANPDIADVQVMSPTSIMIFGKRTGETTFMATDSNGNTLSRRTVIVSQDLTDLRREMSAAIPGQKIKVQSLPNGIVLTGEAKDPSAVADAYKLAQRYIPSGGDIINRIRVSGSNQIHIRVRFAEVQHNINNTLGFNWQNLGNVGGFVFGLATGSPIGAGANILSNRPNNADLNTSNNIIGFSRPGDHFDINGVVDALAQDGLITILAEPNLTAMSGETANFLAGGEFPIPIPQSNGTISIEFKDYGISLAFTPTIIGENRINLHVKPKVSQLTSTGSVTINNIVVPALLTRKAETTIEVASGQSFAIAGLLDNNQTQTVNKYPLLGDLPVLGALFRSDRYKNNQTELVIIITPYIVTPNGEQQLALPTDGFSPPSEVERLVGLRYSGENPETRTMSGYPTGLRIDPPPPASIVPPQSSIQEEVIEPIVEAPLPSSKASMATSSEPDMPSTVVARAPTPARVPDPDPVPAAAPVTPVAISPKPASANALRPATARASPVSLVPTGPGGFMLE